MLEQSRSPQSAEKTGAGGSGARLTEELGLLREQLARRTEQLEDAELRYMDALEASQRRAEILAQYAHDLRSPLAAIIGYAELLEMGVPESLPDCAVECVSRIRAAAQNLQCLVDQVLASPDTAPQFR